MENKKGFCWHSRMWMDFVWSWHTPGCPEMDGHLCENCGYHELREPTAHYKRKERILNDIMNPTP